MNLILDKRVQVGMVFRGGSAGNVLSVITRIDNEVTVKDLSENETKATNVHWAGFGWYKPGCFEFVRQMSKREFSRLVG